LRLAARFGLAYAGFRHDGFAEISFHKIGTEITEIGKPKVGSQKGSAAASKPPASDGAPSAQDPSAG
jgi:hypothetical protein